MSGIDLSSRLRRLALLSEVRLGLYYTIGVLPAAFLGELATVQPGFEGLRLLAAVAGLCTQSVLIAVLAFYRDDEALLAGALLAVIAGVGSLIAWAIAVVAITRSLGAVIVAAAGGALLLPVYFVLTALLFAGLVWILRKFRRWLAPDTIPPAGLEDALESQVPEEKPPRVFLRVAVVLLLAALAYWRPWKPTPWRTHPVSEPTYLARFELERRARRNGIRSVEWHGFTIAAPSTYVLTTAEPTLELLDLVPPESDGNTWPAQMAFLDLDSAAITRFREAGDNCSLAPGRCWTESVAGYVLDCQRSSGVPDPAVLWTPHLECQVPSAQIRVLINAPLPATAELLNVFRQALASRTTAPGPS